MNIEIKLSEGPLPALPCWSVAGAGAVIRFEGVVRPTEQGQPLAALKYEQYPPMSERELRRVAGEVAAAHGVLAIRVAHSHGLVPVGSVSFRLDVASKHRAQGLAATDAFIDRLKREVPLWKVPVYRDTPAADERTT